MLLEFLKTFVVGGFLCLIGQILIDKTGWSPGKILVTFVVSGVILSAVGVYGWLVDFAGAGATVPLTGFGHTLAQGVRKAVASDGLIGAITGGLTATAAGITAAVVFGYLAALLTRPKDKL